MSASASGIKAGKAYVELATDESKLNAGLLRAQAKLKGFGRAVDDIGRSFAGLATAVFAPLALIAKVTAGMGSELADMSDRTGVAVESLSTLGYAAEQSGSSLTDLEAGLKKMTKSVDDAMQGGQGAIDSFDALGISVGELAQLNPESQFKLIAQQLARVDDATLRAALAMDVFGKSGTSLLPLIADDIEGLQSRARSLGIEMSGASANAAKAFGDKMSELWAVVKQGTFSVGSSLLPVLEDAANTFQATATAVTKWVKTHEDAIRSAGSLVLKVAAIAAGMGATLIVVGKLSVALGTMVSVVRTVNIALTALAANPFAAALAATVATIYAVNVAFKALTGYTAKLSDAVEELTSKNDKLRETDTLRLKRLQQLAESENLNSSEMSEAVKIISALQAKYGDLGITLDQTSGKLEGLAQAQSRVAKQMRDSALHDVQASLIEAMRNKDELEAEMNGVLNEVSFRFVDVGIGDGDKARGEAAKAVDRKLDSVWQRILSLKARRKALLAGDDLASSIAPDITSELQSAIAHGGPSTRQEVAARKAAADAAVELAKIEAEAAAKRMDSYEREITDVRALADEKRKLLEQIIAGELARPGGGRGSEVDSLQKKLAAVSLDTEQQITSVKARQEDERKKIAAESAEYMMGLQQEIAQAQGRSADAANIAADIFLKKETERIKAMGLSIEQQKQALAMVQQIADGMRDMSSSAGDFMLDLQRQAAETAGDTATVTKLNKEAFRNQMQQRIKGLGLTGDQAAQAQKLIDQIAAGMGAATARIAGIGVKGTFNAAELRGFSAGGASDKLLQLSQRIANGIDKLNKNVENLDPLTYG